LRRGHQLGARRLGWPSASVADFIREAERSLELDSDLPAFLAGDRKPSGSAEQLDLASLCRLPGKRRYAAAARFYADAFAARPALMDNLQAGHRYRAACCAALAGCGRGEDKPEPDAQGRARLRRQALDWLRADLAAWTKVVEKGPPQERTLVQRKLQHWQKDPALAGLRDPDALAKLPEAEREACRKLWADVDALLQRARGPE
jgi:hypothetical protein